MNYVTLQLNFNWLCKHVEKIRRSQNFMLTYSCTKYVFPVNNFALTIQARSDGTSNVVFEALIISCHV